MSAPASQPQGPGNQVVPRRFRLPQMVVSEGPLQALKWVALVAMVVDHVNKYLFDWAHPWMFAVGRLAMPLFGLVLAYNLARPAVTRAGSQAYFRTARRIGLVGVIATVPFIGAGHVAAGWWPFNIMFTLAAAVVVTGLIASDAKAAAMVVLLLAGPFVEFFWPAITLVVAAHAYFRRPSGFALAIVIASLVLIGVINQTQIAFLALALFVAATTVDFKFPRLRRFFYVVYPVHLGVLWIAQHAMR